MKYRQPDNRSSPARLWGALQAALAASASLAAGCGVSVDAPQCSFFSNVCNPDLSSLTLSFPLATVVPQRKSAQVGTAVVLTVQWSGFEQPSFQWRRSADGGQTWADILGATGAVLTLPAVNLADNGALFQVDVREKGTSLLKSTGGLLAVSAMPPVVFSDGTFDAAAWAHTVAPPAQSGTEVREGQALSGGYPDAYFAMNYALPAGAASLRVFHVSQVALYDPAAQGAILAIDYAEDCLVTSTSRGISYAATSLLLEQGARRFMASTTSACANNNAWHASPPLPSLRAADFQLASGPACGAGESCPDFSAQAAPLRLGFMRQVQQNAGSEAGTMVHGIDNWKATVWRR